MEDVYQAAISNMVRTLRGFERRVPSPQLVELLGRTNYRYKEQTVHQALVMKLARLISALQASQLLLAAGLLQDFGASQRVIDEMNEDVAFLSVATIRGEWTQWHKRFLKEFWQEEFDGPTAFTSSQKRDRVSREKVRGYLGRIEAGVFDQSTRTRTSEIVARAYSGYVHGAGSHIMEMYYGNPPSFQAAGQSDSPFLAGHVESLQDYFLRAICSFGFAAAAFGDGALKETITDFRTRFEQRCGMTFDPKDLAEVARRQREGRPSGD